LAWGAALVGGALVGGGSGGGGCALSAGRRGWEGEGGNREGKARVEAEAGRVDGEEGGRGRR
jgi:hypothetical protein